MISEPNNIDVELVGSELVDSELVMPNWTRQTGHVELDMTQ